MGRYRQGGTVVSTDDLQSLAIILIGLAVVIPGIASLWRGR